MKKILDSITLELTVLLLVFALLLQNQLLYMNIDSTTFVLLNILTFLAIYLFWPIIQLSSHYSIKSYYICNWSIYNVF